MPTLVDLYDNAYAHYDAEVYREVRVGTYGQDLGQTSWVTNAESREIPGLLHLKAESYVLEIGCGSGRYALQIVEAVGCRVLGIDINEPGVKNANDLAAARKLSTQAVFERHDASKKLAFDGQIFDAVLANDVVCHIPGRESLFQEVFRVLKPLGRFLFSDALVIGGVISAQEIATRSSIGYYLFSPPHHNEHLLQVAGFGPIEARDTTENAALIAQRWRDARNERRSALVDLEGEENFEGLQRFLSGVNTLCSERRLLRYLYCAQKPGYEGPLG